MKTKTEKILVALAVLALLGAIGYSIEWGAQLLTLVSSFVNLEWSKHTYAADENLFKLRENSKWLFTKCWSLLIAVPVMKALIWYLVFALLQKLKIKNPFSWEVEERLERIAYLLLGVWVISIIGKIYIDWLSKNLGIPLHGVVIGDEYLFIAGIVYIISQIFKRGIEIQEENQLTV